MRKVISIVVTPRHKDDHKVVTALCDDGTIWVIGTMSSEWTQMPPIPQEDDE